MNFESTASNNGGKIPSQSDLPVVVQTSMRIATHFVLIHVALVICILSVIFFAVPDLKSRFERSGLVPSESFVRFIHLSDNVVNYWYLLAFVAPLILVADFRVMLWGASLRGRTWMNTLGKCVTAILIANLALVVFLLLKGRSLT